jgi:hypothetical protein
MNRSRLVWGLVWGYFLGSGGANAGAPEAAPPGDDANWPCEQVLVPEVSAAVVWDGPSVDDLGASWREVPEVAELVARISEPHADQASSERAIAGFAAGLKDEDREGMLTLLFAGVLETLNADRAMLIRGIHRYSRDQERRARALDDDLQEMIRLEQEPGEEATQRLADLRERITWEQRVFDDREKSIRFLCARPVAVEQRLGALARAIAQHLP